MLECPRGLQRFFLDLCITALGSHHQPTGVRYRFKSSILLTLSNYASEPITTCVHGYDSLFFGVVRHKGFVGRQLLFQLVEGLLLRGVPYPVSILFKQVSNRFGHSGKVRQELHLLVHHAEKYFGSGSSVMALTFAGSFLIPSLSIT